PGSTAPGPVELLTAAEERIVANRQIRGSFTECTITAWRGLSAELLGHLGHLEPYSDGAEPGQVLRPVPTPAAIETEKRTPANRLAFSNGSAVQTPVEGKLAPKANFIRASGEYHA